MNDRRRRIARVCAHLKERGADFTLRELADNTATAAAAADALACGVAEIAKSVVFRRRRDDAPVVAVLCGGDRVDTAKLAAVTGEAMAKADAAFVKTRCGFEIGGVAPVAHGGDTIMDARLRRFARIWAAAGSAYAVFGIAPAALASASDAVVADIADIAG